MCRFLLLVLVGFLLSFGVNAQTPDTLAHQNKLESITHRKDSLTSKPFKPSVKRSKVRIDHPDSTHSPHTAVMRSLMIPGWGQIYNRHGLWWRLPAIYGGLGSLVYNIISNGVDYNKFLKESEWRTHGRIGDEPLRIYNNSVITNVADQTIYDYKDNLRRNRDLSIFAFVAAWGVTAIDAYVEAKFMHSYSMDDNLSFKITPSVLTQPVYASNFNTFTPVLKLTITF